MTSPPTKKELEGIEKMTSRSARFSALRSVRDVPLGMLLHDQPEREAIWQLILADAPKTEAGGSLKPTDTVVQMYRSVRFWRHVRFLGTYKGFVKGKLDLTGRHPERWNEFILQFAEYMKQFEDLVPTLKATHLTHKFEDYEFTDTSYEIQDPERYSQWIDRWELDGSRSKSIITATFNSRELYEQKLPPKLQQLQFLELPQELLEQIFDHCEKQDMVSLAKTCRSLKHSGYAHLLQELQLGFYSYKYDIEEASKVPEGFDPEGDEDSLPLVLPMVESARDWLVKHAENLLSQQNRLEFVKKAHFDMNARSIVPYWALRGFYIPEELADDLLGPVKRSFIKILPAFANLQTLELTHFELDLTAVRTLCMLSTLQVLSLVYSRFEQATAAYLREEEHNLTMNVPSLRLRPRIGEWIMVSLWHTLCFCPSVRNLTIRHSSSKDLQRTMTFPPPEIWSKFKCSLFTIERLFLDGLGSRRIDEFFNWIHTARSAPDGQPSRPLTLTHFKFAPSATWSDAHVLSVLQALQSPLMKVLSLEALPFELGRTNTVRQIARCFPNLQALTLAIRANRRQWMMKVVTWKDPVWSFAQTLTGFSCLEHFEWNNDIPPHTSTPSPFVEMEEHEVEGTFKEDGSPFYCWDALYFDDYHLNAAPFAAHCPTLKTWVANKGAVLTSDQILCEIRRRPQSKSLNHGEEVKIVCVPKRDRPDLGRYDPGTYNSEYSTWPNVDP